MRTLCRSFTVIELLLISAVIAILVSLLSPAFERIRAMGQRTQSETTLKELERAWPDASTGSMNSHRNLDVPNV